jgi:hypothetical protein
LRDGSRGTTGGSFMRLSKVLVIGEVALSCALLIVVGTMIRGIMTLDRIDLGFDSSRLLSARIALFTTTYPTGADQVRLFEKLTDRLRGDAEVVEASVATTLPMRFGATRDILPTGAAAGRRRCIAESAHGAPMTVSRQYLRLAHAARTLLRCARLAGGQRVAVVDRSSPSAMPMAATSSGGSSVWIHAAPTVRSVTIIGVIAPLKLDAPGDEVQPVAGATVRIRHAMSAWSCTRAREPRRLRRGSTRSCAKSTPTHRCTGCAISRPSIAEATFGEHVVAEMFGVFGVIALILAGAGLYGIMAFSVASARARSACAARSARAGGWGTAHPVRAHRLAARTWPRRRLALAYRWRGY